MSDKLHQILQQVAAGTLSPQEATTCIENLPAEVPHALVALDPPKRIVIKGGALRLTVVGDPTVAEAVADGPHRMERAGDDLLITTNITEGDYATEPPRSAFVNWLAQVMDRVGAALTVRVNPDLPLQVLVVGGTLDLSRVSGGVSVGVEAGSARVVDGTGPLKLDVMSGSAKVDWTFTGDSTVQADMGSATILVRPESDVSITAEASLGQAVIKAHDGIRKAMSEGATEPVTVGAGTGTLRAATRMGSTVVTIA